MGSFAPRDHRNELKLITRDRERALYENRDDVPCPVCGEAFRRLLATEERSRQLVSQDPRTLCFLNEGDELFLFSH